LWQRIPGSRATGGSWKFSGLPELKQERVLSWLHQGAQPTVTVKTLLRRSGVWKQFEAEKAAKKKGA
jgi:small subunit ribosomal protein S16